MLKEISSTGRAHKEAGCRWFRSERADLYLWPERENSGVAVDAFEYCYRLLDKEFRVSWNNQAGIRHARVDDGESGPLRNDSPMIVPGNPPDLAMAARHFREEGLGMDPGIYRFILNLLYEQIEDDTCVGDVDRESI